MQILKTSIMSNPARRLRHQRESHDNGSIHGHTRRADDIDVNADEGDQVVCVRFVVMMSRDGGARIWR